MQMIQFFNSNSVKLFSFIFSVMYKLNIFIFKYQISIQSDYNFFQHILLTTIMSRMSIQGTVYNEELLQQSQYDEDRIEQIYHFPADIQKAQIHDRATTFGYNPKHMANKQRPPLCPCCQLPINTAKIVLSYGTTPSADKVKVGSNVFMLNSGTSMFFTFIKMAVIFLLLRFLITDMYNMISSTSATYCTENPDKCSSMSTLSAYNKNTEKDEGMVNAVDILNLISVLASIVFFIFYRKYQFRIYSIAESTSFSQDDYTLFVENIPIYIPQEKGNQISYQDHLKKDFEKKIDDWIQLVIKTEGKNNRLEGDFFTLTKTINVRAKPKVRSVSLCFDLTQMEKISSLRQSLMEEHIKNVLSKIDVPSSSSPFFVPNQIKTVNKEYIELSKRFAMDESSSFNLSHFVGKAYVSFEYQHYGQFLMRQYEANNLVKINQKPLTLSSASQPSDVYWFNMRISDDVRLKSIAKSYLILIMALTFSFGALLGLQLLQLTKTPDQQTTTTNHAAEQSSFLSYAFTLLMTILINVINYILTVAIQTLTESQKHKSKTDQITSLMIKNIIAQFFNTALIYYIISVINPQIGPLTQNGIVVKIMSLVAVSGAVNIVMNILQIGSLITCLLNKWKYKNKKQVDVFQVQLNQDFQDPEFNFAQRYAYYIMQVYVVSFYACIAPSITIILALIFVAQYWVDKANLFFRCSCPTDFNYQLSRLTLKIFEFSILVFAVGNLIFLPEIHYSQEQAYHILNWITFGIAVLYVAFAIFLPKKWEQKLFYYETIVGQSYTSCLNNHYFNKVYWLSNPATNFAKERDMNNGKKFVNYDVGKQCIASKKDFQNFQKAEERESIVQKYDAKDESVIKQVFKEFTPKIDVNQSKQ